MQLIRNLAIPEERDERAMSASVASIGNFDGVHLGHQRLIRDLIDYGRRAGLPVTLVTFEPHPLEFFAGDRAPPRLMTLRQKLEMFCEFGVDRVCCLRFDRTLANTEAEDFVERILVKGLNVRHLVVGDDFHFGRERRGDFALLQSEAERFRFSVERAPTYQVEGERVSSSAIRVCLAKSDFGRARDLLGRPYTIGGRVIHGEKRGRKFGFPTINLKLHHRTTPLAGIFAVRVRGLSNGNSAAVPLIGAGYVGTRPTVSGQRLVLEVHVLDYHGDCYGWPVTVEFQAKIRDDVRFDSVEAMQTQMRKDIESVRAYFRELGVT